MQRDEIIDEIYQLSSFAVGNGDVCEIIARRLRKLAEKVERVMEDGEAGLIVRMSNLCFTDRTLYGVDQQGRIWFIDMRNGEWALHGNPTEPELPPDEGVGR
jgi:hypothetical protein